MHQKMKWWWVVDSDDGETDTWRLKKVEKWRRWSGLRCNGFRIVYRFRHDFDLAKVELVILTANKHLLSSTQTLSCFRVLLLSSLDTIRTAVIPSLQYVNIDTIGEMLKILKAWLVRCAGLCFEACMATLKQSNALACWGLHQFWVYPPTWEDKSSNNDRVWNESVDPNCPFYLEKL